MEGTNTLPLPEAHKDQLLPIAASLMPDQKVVALEPALFNYSQDPFEKALIQAGNARSDLIRGMQVVFVAGLPSVIDGGLHSILFVPKEWENHDHLAMEIATRYAARGRRLTPIGESQRAATLPMPTVVAVKTEREGVLLEGVDVEKIWREHGRAIAEFDVARAWTEDHLHGDHPCITISLEQFVAHARRYPNFYKEGVHPVVYANRAFYRVKPGFKALLNGPPEGLLEEPPLSPQESIRLLIRQKINFVDQRATYDLFTSERQIWPPESELDLITVLELNLYDMIVVDSPPSPTFWSRLEPFIPFETYYQGTFNASVLSWVSSLLRISEAFALPEVDEIINTTLGAVRGFLRDTKLPGYGQSSNKQPPLLPQGDGRAFQELLKLKESPELLVKLLRLLQTNMLKSLKFYRQHPPRYLPFMASPLIQSIVFNCSKTWALRAIVDNTGPSEGFPGRLVNIIFLLGICIPPALGDRAEQVLGLALRRNWMRGDEEKLTSHLGRLIYTQRSVAMHALFVDGRRFESAPLLTAKQLLNYRLETAALPGNLSTVVEQVEKCSEETPLDIIGQSTRASREPAKAILIEATQNGVDAMRRNGTRGALKYDITLTEVGEQRALTLEVVDPVGMASLETLLFNFLIPGASDKKGRKEAGEMGTGAFQYYAQASMCTVRTRLLETGQVVALRVVPIRNESGAIVDLNLRMVEEHDSSFKGTEARVMLQPEEADVANLHALETLDFLKTVIASTTVHGVTLSFEDETFSAYEREAKVITDGLYSMRKRSDESPGVVVTNGIPLGPLSDFLEDDEGFPRDWIEPLSKGWDLHIPKGAYTPELSRTKITYDKEKVRHFIGQAIFERLPNHLVTHFDSPAGNMVQVLPGKAPTQKTLESFVMYTPIGRANGRSIHDLLHAGYNAMIGDLESMRSRLVEELTPENYTEKSKEIEKACTTILQAWAKNNHTPVIRTLILWFKPKVASFARQIPSRESIAFKRDPQKLFVEQTLAATAVAGTGFVAPLRAMEQALQNYCRAAVPGVTFRFKHAPDDSWSAHYLPNTNAIEVNLDPAKGYSIADILEVGAALARGKMPTGKGAELILPSARSAGTINHELLHAMRHQDHSTAGTHDPNPQTGLPFEEEASALGRTLHRKGHLTTLIPKTSATPDQLNTLRQALMDRPYALTSWAVQASNSARYST